MSDRPRLSDPPTLEEFSAWLLNHVDADHLAEIGLSPDVIGPADNLFQQGVVDSFTMVELLSIVEQRFGVELDVMDVDPEVFFTLNGLYEHVLQSLGPETQSAS